MDSPCAGLQCQQSGVNDSTTVGVTEAEGFLGMLGSCGLQTWSAHCVLLPVTALPPEQQAVRTAFKRIT